MRFFLKKVVHLLTHCVLLLSVSNLSYAAETVCNNNGGAGWAITDFGTTNLSIPFAFGDVSEIFDINIQTDIAHTWVGDLTVRATSPQNTTVTLFERPGTPDPEFDTTTSFGCGRDDILVTFDDESPNPPIENESCSDPVVTPVFSGTHLPHNPAPNDLAAYDGEDPTGNWNIYLSDSANQDTGTLNQVCLTAAFAAVTFDKWVSTNASCSDTINTIAVAPGADVYFCYTVLNPSTETFTINTGDATDSQGHDITALETTYLQNASQTVIVGPIVAGGSELPNNTSTVNNASVTATFSTANFTGALTTPETATATVGNPNFTISTKTVIDLNGGSAEPGDILEYTITINESAGFYTSGIQVIDTVDANLGSINITTLPAGATNNTTGNDIDITGISVAANGTQTIVFEVTIATGAVAGTNIDNTATISHAASGISFDAVAPTIIISAPNLTSSTKVEEDVNGTPALAGDLIRYTITINETNGKPATSVTVTDIVDSNLTNVNVISIPAGATDNTLGNNIDISNISVIADGSETIVFEANILTSASIGTNIDNTADIVDVPTGASTTVVAGTITVGSLPASGLKQLYLDNLNSTLDLTRVTPTTNTDSQFFSGGNSITIDQTPVFQAPFIISDGSTVNVFLNLERNNLSGERTAQVDMYNGNAGTLIGSNSQTWNSNSTQYLTFPISIVGDQNFATNDFVRIVVTNTSTNNRDFRIRSDIGDNVSQLEMSSTTVINVDTVTTYFAAYPDTTQYTSYEPGSTVYIRSSVSDPFGNADITGATITITDPSSTVQINSDAMTSVATPTGASRLYEYQYTIPAGPEGIWNLSVTANDGFEGTISHTAQSNMIVGTAIITISKNSTVLSDPINATSPKAIPGAIVEYAVNISNAGYGYINTDSVILTDPIATATTFFFGSPIDPVTFTDGATASGLSLTFIDLASTTDDVDFSNDGGLTFVTPSSDASGFDSTSPPINFIRINPKGEFRGGDTVNNPSMEIKFRVRVN